MKLDTGLVWEEGEIFASDEETSLTGVVVCQHPGVTDLHTNTAFNVGNTTCPHCVRAQGVRDTPRVLTFVSTEPASAFRHGRRWRAPAVADADGEGHGGGQRRGHRGASQIFFASAQGCVSTTLRRAFRTRDANERADDARSRVADDTRSFDSRDRDVLARNTRASPAARPPGRDDPIVVKATK